MLLDSLEQWSYIGVFVLAAIPWVELAAVVPLGIVIGLAPVPVALLGFLGNYITVMVLILLFDRWNRWRARRKKAQLEYAAAGTTTNNRIGIEDGNQTGANTETGTSKRSKRARRIWERYGLPGLALISPLITGTHIAAAAAMAFKAPKQKVIVWMTISLLLWTAVLAAAAYYGFDYLGIIRTDLFEGRE